MIKRDHLLEARGTALIISIQISQISPLEFTCPEMKISPSQISVSSITLDLLLCGLRWERYATLCATAAAAAGQKMKCFKNFDVDVTLFFVGFGTEGCGDVAFSFCSTDNQQPHSAARVLLSKIRAHIQYLLSVTQVHE